MAWQSACCYFRCVVSTKLPKISSIHSHIPGSVVRECVWGTAKHEWLRGHNNSMWWQAWKNTIIRQNKLHLYQHFWKKPQALMKPEHTYKAETPDLVVANESQCSWHFSSRSWVVWLLAGQRQAGRHHSMYLQHKKKEKKKVEKRQSLMRSWICNKQQVHGGQGATGCCGRALIFWHGSERKHSLHASRD